MIATVLVYAEGRTFEDAVYNMYKEYVKLVSTGKAYGKSWL